VVQHEDQMPTVTPEAIQYVEIIERLLQQNQALQKQLQQAQLEIAALNVQVDQYVFYDLRSTFSNISMAIQMLEIMLKQLGKLRLHSASIDSYFQLIKEECFNGTQLISQLPDETVTRDKVG
jgi:hypothetical protein